MKKQLPAQQAQRSTYPGRTRAWRTTAVAIAATLALGLPVLDAQALALGRIAVQSALGEPLRAEIDIPQITPDEIASLRTAAATPEAFRAAGLERSAALSDLQISLQQRPGGGYYLRLASERVVNEPFIDLVLEATWASGRIVRDYTLLFDPPVARPAASLPPQVAPLSTFAPAAVAPRPAATPAASASPNANVATPKRLAVQPGQTAAGIALAHRIPTLSLDQMLLALLRANPEAFVDGNVNRLKAGSVIELPSPDQVTQVDPAAARETVIAQSRDFNEFRRRLAEGVEATAPSADTASARQASGRLEARVEERRAAPSSPDRLTLSKGSIEQRGANTEDTAAEDRLAGERTAQEAAERVVELNRNIAELSRLGGSASAPDGARLSETALPEAALPLAVPAGRASQPAPATTPTAAEPPALIDQVRDHPLSPVGAAALLAVLLGLLLYRRGRHRPSTALDAAEPGGWQEPVHGLNSPTDTFTAAAAVTTAGTQAGPPTLIDAGDPVDPVAEADVYLAYGREQQAEETLKQALDAAPQRADIYAKLLQIHARRRDAVAFELTALQAHAITHARGPEWDQIAQWGRDLLPGHPMFQQADTTPAPTWADTAKPAPLSLDAGDLDLDFAPRPSSPLFLAAPDAATPSGLDLDIASFQRATGGHQAAPSTPTPRTDTGTGAEEGTDDLQPYEAGSRAEAPAGLMKFRLPDISLDLGADAKDLATKLALAEEFTSIGDLEGARSLVEEVLAQASGEQRQQAQRLLAGLG